jgi:diguanylate cyclase (GGDEF)-like protein/PAS domain S-box-containing protein
MATEPAPKVLQALVNNCPCGMMYLDKNGTVQWVNPTMAELVGMEREQLVGLDSWAVNDEPLQHLFGKDEVVQIAMSGGSAAVWLHRTEHATDGDSGKLLFFMDITELRDALIERQRLSAKLEASTIRDSATGLLNRKGAFQNLEAQVSRSRRYGNPLSAVLIRVEGYRELQRERGGDSAKSWLLGIGHAINEQIRWTDVLGRINDTVDFLLILPETSADAAEQLASKIGERLAHYSSEELSEQGVGVQFGVAEWAKGDDAGKLLQRAEEALA